MNSIQSMHMNLAMLYHDISSLLVEVADVLLLMSDEIYKEEKPMKKKETKSKAIVKKKMEKVGKEFKEGELHSGSKKGPIVTNPKQMQAIAFGQARKMGAKVPKKKSK